MVYKPMFQKMYPEITINSDMDYFLKRQFCLKLGRIFENDKDGLIDFLAGYENNILWYTTILDGGCCLWMNEDTLIEFVGLFHEHFTIKIWKYFSENQRYLKFNKFLRKYKDKLDWYLISKSKKFNLQEFVEFIDSVNEITFANENYYRHDFMIQLKDFLKSHGDLITDEK